MSRRIAVDLHDQIIKLRPEWLSEHDEDGAVKVVMTGDGRYVEVQGTAEGRPFTREQLMRMTDVGAAAIARFTEVQRAALAAR